jgi:hypothetical protein
VNPALDRNFFQFAYVTRDLDAAIDHYRSIYGIEQFFMVDTRDFTPDPALRAAFAWHGETMIELVQPVETPNPVYINVLDRSESLTALHHFGHVCSTESEWEEVRAALAAANIPIAREDHIPGLMKFIYADFRAVHGHFREYILQDAPQSFFGLVPHN